MRDKVWCLTLYSPGSLCPQGDTPRRESRLPNSPRQLKPPAKNANRSTLLHTLRCVTMAPPKLVACLALTISCAVGFVPAAPRASFQWRTRARGGCQSGEFATLSEQPLQHEPRGTAAHGCVLRGTIVVSHPVPAAIPYARDELPLTAGSRRVVLILFCVVCGRF